MRQFPPLAFLPPVFLLPALVVLLLTASGCKRNSFDYANTEAPQGAPQYTFNPDLNQPGLSKPTEAK